MTPTLYERSEGDYPVWRHAQAIQAAVTRRMAQLRRLWLDPAECTECDGYGFLAVEHDTPHPGFVVVDHVEADWNKCPRCSHHPGIDPAAARFVEQIGIVEDNDVST